MLDIAVRIVCLHFHHPRRAQIEGTLRLTLCLI